MVSIFGPPHMLCVGAADNAASGPSQMFVCHTRAQTRGVAVVPVCSGSWGTHRLHLQLTALFQAGTSPPLCGLMCSTYLWGPTGDTVGHGLEQKSWCWAANLAEEAKSARKLKVK